MAKKKTKKIPALRVVTAYGVLSTVARMAKEEPLRIAMGDWLIRQGDGWAATPRGKFPACGTVGCIGGWIEVLTGEHRVTSTMGLSTQQADELFYNNTLCGEGGQQTRRHANHVIAHIRRFQKKYRKQLMAHRIM